MTRKKVEKSAYLKLIAIKVILNCIYIIRVKCVLKQIVLK